MLNTSWLRNAFNDQFMFLIFPGAFPQVAVRLALWAVF
jgi:hypothetical protein